MNVAEFSAAVFLISAAAGFLGALTGLGGGVVITPVLTLLFHVDIRYAIGATLVSVIATSSGAAAAFVREGFSNVRIGMFLEIATASGAVIGAMLLYSAYLTGRTHQDEPSREQQPDPLAVRFKMNSTYPGPAGPVAYAVR